MTRLLRLLFILAALSAAACAGPSFDEAAWAEKVDNEESYKLYAAHINDKGRFFNPWLAPEEDNATFMERFLRLRFSKDEDHDRFQEELYHKVDNDYSYLKDGGESISFVGHATFIIQTGSTTILTDPFLSSRALIMKKEVLVDFDPDMLPPGCVVLISHNHYDHLDKDTVVELIKRDAVFVVPLKLKDFFTGLGAENVHELDWWESVMIKGVNYTFLPSQHWSRRIGQSADTTLWGGYMIEAGKTIYFSGDTGYFVGFKEFGKMYGIDYALVGAGAYTPRWFMHYMHQNVAEFIKAGEDLKAAKVIPFHFGVIHLGKESIYYPLYEIDRYLKSHPEDSGRITPLRVGEYIMID